MLAKTAITLLAFLTLSSALNATLEQSLFFVSPGNWLSYNMYQTAQGVIARSFEPTPVGSPPHDVYSLIDMKTFEVTTILTDIVTACGQGASDFDKIHYHAPTSTLVYYCLTNNSLLILDEQDFTVKGAIATGISSTFGQVKLITDGYSITILGMTGLLSQTPSPTQFIRISLQTKEIVNNITFDHDLSEGEAVTGYASNGKDLYILTNTIADKWVMANNVSVYSMYLISNAYTLTKLATVNNNYTSIFSVLYSVGDLLVTSNNRTAVIMTQKGDIIGEISDIAVKNFLPNNIAIVAEYGSSDFYVLCDDFTLYKISSKSGGYTKDIFGQAIDMQFAHGTNKDNTLLMVTTNYYNFTITDLKTSQLVYTTYIMYVYLMLTDTTFVNINTDDNPWMLYIAPRKAPFLPKGIPVNDGYIYDQKNQILTYLNATTDYVCQFVQVDLKTGDVSIPLTFNSTVDATCPCGLLNVTNNEHGPQATLICLDYSYLIVSQTFGQVTFNPPASEHGVETLVADYDTLSVYHFVSEPSEAITTVFAYDYDSTTKNFTLNTTINNTELYITEFDIEPGQVLGLSDDEFNVIQVPSLQQKTVTMNGPWDTVSPFQDNSGKLYTIFTSFRQYGTTPVIYYDDHFDTIPETSNITIAAGAAGTCTYWIGNSWGSFEEIRFYNICASQRVEPTIEDILA